MADTIGWDGSGPASGVRRLAVRAAWVVALLGIAAYLLVPVVQRHRLASAAASLQRQWATARALESARESAVLTASSRAGVGDLDKYLGVVSAAEGEEADRLALLARAVPRHGTGDVARAAAAVVRACTAMVRDLRHGAASPEVSFSGLVPDPLTPDTEELLTAATTSVEAMAGAHHLRPPTATRVTLAQATARLAVLRRVTDRPVDLRLVLVAAGNATAWDLRTGESEPLALANPPDSFALVPVDGGIVTGGDGGHQLVPLDGSPTRPLPPADAYVSAGGDGVWRVFDGRVRRYDASLRPIGPWRRLPERRDYVTAASGDALAVQVPFPDAGFGTSLWWPGTGRIELLPEVCAADVLAGRSSFAYADCAHTRVTVLDEPTGRRTVLHAPAGLRFDFQPVQMSSDGRLLACDLLPKDNDNENRRRVGVFDVRTGTVTLPAMAVDMNPQGWSADGSTLLLAQTFSVGAASLLPLAYWHVGDDALHSIRIDGSTSLDTVGTVS